MGKKFDKKGKMLPEDSELSYDSEVVSDRRMSDDALSVDSEEAAMKKEEDEKKNARKTGKVQDRADTKNKLKLGEFHRNATNKKKIRKPTTKK